MKANMLQAMKQVKKMQAEMEKVQNELAEKTVEVNAGGGVITIVITGTLEVKKITVDPEVLDDKEMLEDVLTAAVNEGIKQAQELSAREMAKVTGGLNIPGMPDGLF